MKRAVAAFALGMVFGLSACGDHLGTYTVEDARLVRDLPQNETLDWPRHSHPEYLRIELSSLFDLSGANTGPGLYTDADFCPLRDSHRLIAFEPIAKDEVAVGHRRLRPDRRDGRFHYFVYVVPSSPSRKLFANSEDQIPEYDLRQQRRDICLRAFVPGYNITPSRSDIIRVSADTLARGLTTTYQSSSR